MTTKVLSIDPKVIPLDEDQRAGVPAGVYVFSVRLATGDTPPEHHLLITAYHPPLERSAFGLITEQVRQREDACVEYCIADSPGHAEVVIAPDGPKTSAFNVAAVTAVVKASCGWDESDPIRVTVNGDELAVHTCFDGEHWMASRP